MKLGTQVGLGPDHIVLDGDPAAPPPKGHSPPQFSALICCGQVAGWIRRKHMLWCARRHSLKLASNLSATSFEPASVMEFAF